METFRENNDRYISDIREIKSQSDNINHLENIIIDKKRFRKEEIQILRKEYQDLIQTYSEIIKKILG
jgi:hypothetical protein